MSRYLLSDRAKADLRSTVDYIARDNPDAARRWAAKVRDRIRAAARTPGIGRKVPEFNRVELREVFLGNYRIVFRVRPKQIVILRIREGHRLLEPLKGDE